VKFESLFSVVAPLHLSPYNKQMLVIRTRFPSGHFGSLTIFCWLWSRTNTYSKTQIPIDNWIASRVEFYSSDLLNVLTTDCLLEVVIDYWKSLHQTYKSFLHKCCSLTNGSLLPNIQLVLGIIHQWTSPLSSQQQGTNLSPEKFDKPCLLSFSKWSKAIESGKLVSKTHEMVKK
jgi:hypothetical protein